MGSEMESDRRGRKNVDLENNKEFFTNATKVHVLPNAGSMGIASARLALESICDAQLSGKKPLLWLMAAPNGFAFYRAFVELCAANPIYAALCAPTEFYQFDNYSIARSDRRFPITFRHLLESHLFKPLARVVGELKGIHLCWNLARAMSIRLRRPARVGSSLSLRVRDYSSCNSGASAWMDTGDYTAAKHLWVETRESSASP